MVHSDVGRKILALGFFQVSISQFHRLLFEHVIYIYAYIYIYRHTPTLNPKPSTLNPNAPI